MKKPILYLFPDTNLFIQCRPLDRLDWSELGDFAEIHLIVSRPVQREIDNQKIRGNDRVGQRARKTYPLFRKVIISETGYELVNDDPPVKLFFQSQSLPAEELVNTLDYTKPDDEIVGCCYRYMQENTCLDVRLFTHDTGPMMSAKSVSLPFIPINDDWLKQPEHNEYEQKIARLESELNQMKRAEPQFAIRCVDERNEEVDSLDIEYYLYEELSDGEVASFLEILKDRFPPATKVYRPRRETYGEIFGDLNYVPPPKASIVRYENEEYPSWLDGCESILVKLHETLEKKNLPHFRFLAQNEGNRPGQDSLVIITARGNFKICPPEYIDEEDEKREDATLRLPIPPHVPQGQLIPTSRTRLLDAFSQNIGSRIDTELFKLSEYIPVGPNRRRDPNAFYYKPSWSEVPVKSFSLECAQWRHLEKPKPFEGLIFVEGDINEVKGALEFEIHSENLSKPVKTFIPVKIKVKYMSTKDVAQQLIEELKGASPSGI